MLKFRAFLAELVGTAALIFVGILVIKHLGQAESGLVGIALAHGLAIGCLVSATAAISGGHLNPAVTCGLLMAKRIDVPNAIGYIVSQLLGAVIAALLAMFCLPGQAVQYVAGGTPALGVGITPGQGILAEAITTFFLMFVIFGTAVDHRAPKLSGLFIGLTVTMDIFAVGPITGAAMNPARWFGPALVSGSWANSLVYIVGPLIGAAIATLIYVGMLEDRPPLSPTDQVRVDA